jgi:hypothetical protein
LTVSLSPPCPPTVLLCPRMYSSVFKTFSRACQVLLL